MNWTTEKPTTIGWYWWVDEKHERAPQILEVIWENQEGGPLVVWDEGPGNTDNYKGEWMGPLDPPPTDRPLPARAKD